MRVQSVLVIDTPINDTFHPLQLQSRNYRTWLGFAANWSVFASATRDFSPDFADNNADTSTIVVANDDVDVTSELGVEEGGKYSVEHINCVIG